MLPDEGLALLSGGGAEVEEGLGSVSIQTGEESVVSIVAHGEELGTPLRRCLLRRPWETDRGLTDVFHCFTQ